MQYFSLLNCSDTPIFSTQEKKTSNLFPLFPLACNQLRVSLLGVETKVKTKWKQKFVSTLKNDK